MITLNFQRVFSRAFRKLRRVGPQDHKSSDTFRVARLKGHHEVTNLTLPQPQMDIPSSLSLHALSSVPTVIFLNSWTSPNIPVNLLISISPWPRIAKMRANAKKRVARSNSFADSLECGFLRFL